MISLVDNFARILGEILAPDHCRLCSAPAPGGICPACERELPWNRTCCPVCALPQSHHQPCPQCQERERAFDGAWAAFRFATPVQGRIHGLKYRAGFADAQWLGDLMATRLLRRPRPLPDLIVPVPLHSRRLTLRGYNQALELARVISRRTGMPLDARMAQRLRATEDQIGKTAAERRRNMKGAFSFTGDLAGRHIALLDDVMTTGATLEELPRTCRKAGAAKIEAWCVARVA